jgi:hypothetical protein
MQTPSAISATVQSGKLGIAVKVAVVIFFLDLLFDRFTQLIPLYSIAETLSIQNALGMSLKLPHFWTGLLVPACYLGALWAAANFLNRFEITKQFDMDLLLDLKNIGSNLTYGAIAAMLIAPSIESWMNLGGRSFKLHWDIEAVTIGMIGVILKFVSQRAEKMQTKLYSVV